MKKQFTILLILVLFIFSTLFYWYGVRPNQIRKACHIEGKNKMQNALNQKINKAFDEKWNNYSQEKKDELIEKSGSLEKIKESFEKTAIETIINNPFEADSEVVNFLREEEKYFYIECLKEKGLKK